MDIGLEFFTLDQDGNEITVLENDLIVSIAGVTHNAHVIRLEPLAHYGPMLEIEPELIDFVDVVIKPLDREGNDFKDGDQRIDTNRMLPTLPSYKPEITIQAQKKTLNTRLFRPTSTGNSIQSDGYVLAENSRSDQPWHFFQIHYATRLRGR